MATMVRLDNELHAKLRKLSSEEDRPIGKVIEDAIRLYEKEKFWQGVTEDLNQLKQDPTGWKDYQDEIAFFEGGSMDGLENEPPYYTPEEEAGIRAEYDRSRGR
jgi:hypothetical protein